MLSPSALLKNTLRNINRWANVDADAAEPQIPLVENYDKLNSAWVLQVDLTTGGPCGFPIIDPADMPTYIVVKSYDNQGTPPMVNPALQALMDTLPVGLPDEGPDTNPVLPPRPTIPSAQRTPQHLNFRGNGKSTCLICATVLQPKRRKKCPWPEMSDRLICEKCETHYKKSPELADVPTDEARFDILVFYNRDRNCKSCMQHPQGYTLSPEGWICKSCRQSFLWVKEVKAAPANERSLKRRKLYYGRAIFLQRYAHLEEQFLKNGDGRTRCAICHQAFGPPKSSTQSKLSKAWLGMMICLPCYNVEKATHPQFRDNDSSYSFTGTEVSRFVFQFIVFLQLRRWADNRCTRCKKPFAVGEWSSMAANFQWLCFGCYKRWDWERRMIKAVFPHSRAHWAVEYLRFLSYQTPVACQRNFDFGSGGKKGVEIGDEKWEPGDYLLYLQWRIEYDLTLPDLLARRAYTQEVKSIPLGTPCWYCELGLGPDNRGLPAVGSIATGPMCHGCRGEDAIRTANMLDMNKHIRALDLLNRSFPFPPDATHGRALDEAREEALLFQAFRLKFAGHTLECPITRLPIYTNIGARLHSVIIVDHSGKYVRVLCSNAANRMLIIFDLTLAELDIGPRALADRIYEYNVKNHFALLPTDVRDANVEVLDRLRQDFGGNVWEWTPEQNAQMMQRLKETLAFRNWAKTGRKVAESEPTGRKVDGRDVAPDHSHQSGRLNKYILASDNLHMGVFMCLACHFALHEYVGNVLEEFLEYLHKHLYRLLHATADILIHGQPKLREVVTAARGDPELQELFAREGRGEHVDLNDLLHAFETGCLVEAGNALATAMKAKKAPTERLRKVLNPHPVQNPRKGSYPSLFEVDRDELIYPIPDFEPKRRLTGKGVVEKWGEDPAEATEVALTDELVAAFREGEEEADRTIRKEDSPEGGSGVQVEDNSV
ncbi:hypothetical protein MSAN_01274300 [Mycena sanguinolenta]|uniref:Uncharacterized protein n=1 Tax=Mycena sanguinolenta TaxID=230812 RepID=A0A8H7D263_9AGAR|nr:hypothetical protein MSAN_01274300 [Mycena sanguinolenta]